MLICIDASLGDVLAAPGQLRDYAIVALENIAAARRSGKHLIFSDRKTLEIVLRSEDVSRSARAIYARVLDRLPQKKAYFDAVIRRINVVAEDGILNSVAEGNVQVINVSSRYFIDTSLSDKAVLLCENPDDADWYRQVVEVYLAAHSLDKMQIQYEMRNGGGSTVSVVYQQLQEDMVRLCCCVVDSDIKYPGGPIGDTARNVRRVHDQAIPLCEYYILPVREMENLSSVDLYETACAGMAHLEPALEALRKMREISRVGVRFTDIKDGLKVGKLLHAPAEDPHRLYWTNIVEGMNAEVAKWNIQCTQSAMCVNHNECRCILVPGLGSRIAQTITACCGNEDKMKVWSSLDDEVQGHWKQLGELITSWCLGGTSLPAM